jgi:hypothetical protein
MPVETPPNRSDSPTSQQSGQSSQDSYGWIDNLTVNRLMMIIEAAAEIKYQAWLKEGGDQNIDDAITNCEAYINKLPEGHPNRTNMESLLVNCLTDKYLVAKEEESGGILRSAIVLAKKLYDSTSKDDIVLSKRANNYAILLGHRYNSQNEPDDLNKSIELAEEAVAASRQAGTILHYEQGTIVEEAGDATHILNTLCGRLEERFKVKGSLADLNRAIDIWTKLVEAVPLEKSQGARPTWLSNLSSGFLRRYEQSENGEPDDLRRSIDLSREALESIGDKDPKREDALCMVAHSLTQRAVEFNDTNDMDEAIKLLSQAQEIAPHGRKIEIGVNLALRLFQYSQMTFTSNSEEKRENLNLEAVLIATSVLECVPEDHALLPHLHNLIGLCHFYNRRLQSPSERDSAAKMTLEHLERAFNNPNYVPVYYRVQAGRLILRLCCQRGEWKKAHKASMKAISLIPKITSRSIRNTDKQRLLSLDDIVGFSADAAAAGLNCDENGYTALHLLEMGRGLLAASVADLRIDLSELRQKKKHLAERFVALRDRLQESSHQLDQADLDFDALLNEIRGESDFKNFLKPLRQDDIHEAARDGPVVVLSASEFRGVDAILITLKGVRVLRFAEVTMKELEQRSQNLTSLELLEWLWDAMAKPIMDALGFAQPPQDTNAFPRVWWIPTGILSRFPFHAAGHHSTLTPTSTDTVMDRVMSSYSSSIKALLWVRRRPYRPAVPKESQALLVAMTTTQERSYLSHALTEVQKVEKLLNEKSCACITLSNETRKERKDVFRHLEACQIFHFAGHGDEDFFNPLRSALLLDDWKTDPMTVDSLLGLNLSERNCFLAYLSACATSQVTRPKFHDESIHLVSAYQLTGFRHVIGTLWWVDDFTSVQIATETYRNILEGEEHITDVSVCRGLHKAAMKRRNESRNTMVERRGNARGKVNSRKALGRKALGVGSSSKDEDDGVNSVEQYIAEQHRIEQTWIPYVHFGV